MGLLTEAKDFGSKREADSHLSRFATPGKDGSEVTDWLAEGDCLLSEKQYEKAAQAFLKELEIDNKNADALRGLAVSLKSMNSLADSAKTWKLLSRLEPDNLEAYFQRGHCHELQGQVDEAVGAYLEVINRDPNHAPAYNNLGCVLFGAGHIKEACSAFHNAIKLNPELWQAYSSFLALFDYRSDLNRDDILKAYQEFGAKLELKFPPEVERFNQPPKPEKVLRIGFLSRDFHDHSIMFFLMPFLKHYDRSRYEVFCYYDSDLVDEVTQKAAGYIQCWRDVRKQEGTRTAEIIRQDKVDILIDLAGHTENNCLEVFSRKAAPVQISWLGYPATTGVRAMDFRIGDSIVYPDAESEKYATETVLKLPRGYHCYEPASDAPAVSALPAALSDQVTFGSFNKASKISPQIAALWSQVLNAVPHSKLVLKCRWFLDLVVRDRYLALFQSYGIDSSRIELLSWTQERKESLELYSRIDIALDTFPYNGTTTTCESLWMGIPVVTLAGNSVASRTSASLLNQAGHGEWIAHDEAAFVQIATALACNIQELAKIRGNLRNQVRNSDLCQTRNFTNDFETVLRKAWVDGYVNVPEKQARHQNTVESDTAQDAGILTKTAKRGVIYVIWGETQDALLERSMNSLKRVHPELPVEVVRLPENSTLLDKASMFSETPFEATVFLDADTVIMDRLDYGFEKAEKYGLACCICECPWARRYADIEGDMNEYNTGVLFFTEKAKPVFDRWRKYAHEVDSSIRMWYQGEVKIMPYNDQASFAKAIDEWEDTPFVLPLNWNFRPRWHNSLFGPVKIWHDYTDVPATITDWNEHQVVKDTIIQFTHFSIS